MELIEEYPQLRAMYEEIYQICSNIEGVMNMFSKELLEIDRNTVTVSYTHLTLPTN